MALVHTEQGRLYLCVAIDRTSKFAMAQLHARATRRVAADFQGTLVAAVPCQTHTIAAAIRRRHGQRGWAR